MEARHYSISVSVIISITIIVVLLTGIVKALSSIDFTVFLSLAGDELQEDTHGHTNFLILGTGNSDHDGADLTDTIIVASFDKENMLVTMLSIPRDLYVPDDLIGGSRINEVYFRGKRYYESSTEGLEYMKEKTEEMVGVPIHYYIKINFQGFTDLIDAIGGIDVVVEEDLYDPYYPKEDGSGGEEVFAVSAGLHHMDGDIALKYVRSRKTTSDFDRANRQQQILYSIKDKALKTQVILSKEKIQDVLSALKKNIETNIRVKEILTLGSYAGEFNQQQVLHRLIHDDPNLCGGFLYAPSMDNYNGMFVLVPAGGFDYLHRYSDLNFNIPLAAHSDPKIQILNATPKSGIAAEAKQILQRYCFDVTGFGNAETQDKQISTYYYKQKYDEEGNEVDSRPPALDFFRKIFPGIETTDIPAEYTQYMATSDILIEIGSNYPDSENYLEDPFYTLWPIILEMQEANRAATASEEASEE
jgi:polyisoprenyl-teichoic acid--peptidoglycan teichoic acid transferase